ncbi:MAG: YhdH/YhfP family quinone oxidoreductase [Cytophagales bacterium]|nr:YhdH/YhfP family quinone oxidoreductase [Cytophagales bacterium]
MKSFEAYVVRETEDRKYIGSVEKRTLEDLPEGDVLVEVKYAGLNYKDALSAHGNKGVTRKFPHTPGIDASGVIVKSSDANLPEGMEVIVTSYDLGMNTSGAFGQYISVPSSWVVPLPAGLTLKESMILGTGGLTAALCIDALLKNGQTPEDGPIVVTGSTGGVGSMAVAIASKLGFEVIASTGKTASHDFLKSIGASKVMDRAELKELPAKPLLKPMWAGAVDTCGGQTLEALLKTAKYGGSVACCGLVDDASLNMTVFPFILRGVSLLGVDSAECPVGHRKEIWKHLATDWKPGMLEEAATIISMEQLPEYLEKILKGENVGRAVLAY